MSGSIYILQDGQLIGVQQAPYPEEAVLQRQVSRFANELIPGEQIAPDNPRRWFLVTAEAGVPDADDAGSRWSVDHLFLDQDGVPTLVEVKRSCNTDIRRKVIGQMLDYAANALQFWTASDVQRMFEENHEGEDPSLLLDEFLQGEQTSEEFWQKVKTSLHARRIRIVFVADRIPPELQRIVEFLNAQMDPAEVLAVQVSHYDGEFDGKPIKALVPQVLGSSVEKGEPPGTKRKWTEEEFMASLREKKGDAAVATAQRILDWAHSRGLTIWWGEGKKDGSFFPMIVEGVGRRDRYFTFAVWTSGAVQMQLGTMINRIVFSEEDDCVAIFSETFWDIQVSKRS